MQRRWQRATGVVRPLEPATRLPEVNEVTGVTGVTTSAAAATDPDPPSGLQFEQVRPVDPIQPDAPPTLPASPTARTGAANNMVAREASDENADLDEAEKPSRTGSDRSRPGAAQRSNRGSAKKRKSVRTAPSSPGPSAQTSPKSRVSPAQVSQPQVSPSSEPKAPKRSNASDLLGF